MVQLGIFIVVIEKQLDAWEQGYMSTVDTFAFRESTE